MSAISYTETRRILDSTRRVRTDGDRVRLLRLVYAFRERHGMGVTEAARQAPSRSLRAAIREAAARGNQGRKDASAARCAEIQRRLDAGEARAALAKEFGYCSVKSMGNALRRWRATCSHTS